MSDAARLSRAAGKLAGELTDYIDNETWAGSFDALRWSATVDRKLVTVSVTGPMLSCLTASFRLRQPVDPRLKNTTALYFARRLRDATARRLGVEQPTTHQRALP